MVLTRSLSLVCKAECPTQGQTHGISAWDRHRVSASARQHQTGSKGALFSCSGHTALCHCSAQKLNLTALLCGRHEPGSWPRAAEAVMLFQCGFSFPYSPPTVGLTTLPMATCPAKREQELPWFLWVLEPANVLWTLCSRSHFSPCHLLHMAVMAEKCRRLAQLRQHIQGPGSWCDSECRA